MRADLLRPILLVLLIVLGAPPDARGEVRELPESVLLTLPDGAPPAGGWPVFVLMHGYGVNKEDFADLLTVVAGRGAAAIAIDAPTDLGDGRRSWGRASATDATHEYLTRELEPLRDDPVLDWSAMHVGGFSQGGIQSLILVARHPEVYGGALAVSPAGGELPNAWKPRSGPHPLFLIWGTAESERILGTVEHARRMWETAKEPVRTFSHPGGHHFPENWVEVMGGAVEWMLRPE